MGSISSWLRNGDVSYSVCSVEGAWYREAGLGFERSTPSYLARGPGHVAGSHQISVSSALKWESRYPVHSTVVRIE